MNENRKKKWNGYPWWIWFRLEHLIWHIILWICGKLDICSKIRLSIIKMGNLQTFIWFGCGAKTVKSRMYAICMPHRSKKHLVVVFDLFLWITFILINGKSQKYNRNHQGNNYKNNIGFVCLRVCGSWIPNIICHILIRASIVCDCVLINVCSLH